MRGIIMPKVSEIEQISRRIMYWPAFAAGVILVALMLLTVTDIFLRFVFKNPLTGASEVGESMMVCVGFLGIAWAALEKRHIKVDLIVDRFSQRVQKKFDFINYLIVAVLSSIMAVESFNRSLAMQRFGAESDLLHIPQSPFYLVVTAGYVLMFLSTVTLLFISISKEVNK